MLDWTDGHFSFVSEEEFACTAPPRMPHQQHFLITTCLRVSFTPRHIRRLPPRFHRPPQKPFPRNTLQHKPAFYITVPPHNKTPHWPLTTSTHAHNQPTKQTNKQHSVSEVIIKDKGRNDDSTTNNNKQHIHSSTTAHSTLTHPLPLPLPLFW